MDYRTFFVTCGVTRCLNGQKVKYLVLAADNGTNPYMYSDGPYVRTDVWIKNTQEQSIFIRRHGSYWRAPNIDVGGGGEWEKSPTFAHYLSCCHTSYFVFVWRKRMRKEGRKELQMLYIARHT